MIFTAITLPLDNITMRSATLNADAMAGVNRDYRAAYSMAMWPGWLLEPVMLLMLAGVILVVVIALLVPVTFFMPPVPALLTR